MGRCTWLLIQVANIVQHFCITLAIAGIAVCLMSCNAVRYSPVTSPAEVIGTYEGNYAGGAETFVFTKDGKFTQKFVKNNGKILYSSSGSWKLLHTEDGETDIDLSPYYNPSDHGIPGQVYKSKGGSFSIFNSEGVVIVFNDDLNYFVKKTTP